MDTFVGREEDIRNITGYLDFTSSDVQVVHIVGPPGFGKSTLAKQIGHIVLRKGVKVHYADLREITNLDTVAEKVMLSIVDSTKHKVTFDRLEQWVHNQYSNNLLILNNCDEIFETHEEKFLDAVRTLTLSTIQKSVRYILTSQKWEADVGNYYQLHAIYNLSSEAASQLLGKLAPSLTDVQKMQIAELTGNVPLALEVVGAIFKFPNAPTVDEVIHGLRENPVTTLSSSKIHSKLDVSIGLAYSYLSPELKQLCLNLSQFPGSFSGESAFAIFDICSESQTSWYWSRLILQESQLDMLVQRSLLQFNSALKRFHFHQLIQKYFLYVSSQEADSSKLLKQHFENKFQLHFAQSLSKILNGHLVLTVLDVEKHNFQHMFSLFKTAKHVNNTYFGVKVTLLAIQADILELQFFPTEICNFSWNMLMALESYTAAEEASVESFLETYVGVVIETAKLERSLHINADFTIQMLSLRQRRVDDGYEMKLVSNNTYMQFYRILAQYYKENGQEENSTLCHLHIFTTAHDQLDHCYPHCDYFSISVAYANIGDSVHAFQFRELAYEHQWSSLSPMCQAKLCIDLYNDYLNGSLGNSVSQADEFSSIITENVYEYLLTATGSEYLEDVYYDVVDFFKAKSMEKHVFQLQLKMDNIIQSRCDFKKDDLSECLEYFSSAIVHAWKRQCYYLTIESGKMCILILDKLNRQEILATLGFNLSTIIGQSYYHIGNYSDAQIWLKRTLQMIKEGLKGEYSLKLREDRLQTCFYLLISGDYFNVFCYGYITKDLVSLLFAQIKEDIYEVYNSQQPAPKKQPAAETVILSTETGVTEEKYSFIWSQFNHYVHKFQCAIDKHISRVDIFLSQVSKYMITYVLLMMFLHILILLVYNVSMRICILLLSFFFTRQQSLHCFKFTVNASTIFMFIFVLGLDVFY